jgi:photosystem II stability/assembly factor-like uncharacterized protein
MKRLYLATILLGLCHSIAHTQWQQQTLRSDVDLRGLCAVSAKVAWVSGTKGTYGRTTDAGKTWSVATVPGAANLDFRDVEAFGEATAYLLSAGPGDRSRIYKTEDGGKTWSLQFKNPNRQAFFNALAFWDDKHGVALGDPVQGQFQLLVTEDGGTDWKRLSAIKLPPALANEGAFAASGTCLVTYGQKDVWFCTGGAETARVFHSGDRGRNWTVSKTPVVAGTASAGIFSIAFRDHNHSMIVGGDYRKPSASVATAALSSDGGKTWIVLDRSFGYRSGVAWGKIGGSWSGHWVRTFLWTRASPGKRWIARTHNSVAFTWTGEGWAVGPQGRIARFAK